MAGAASSSPRRARSDPRGRTNASRPWLRRLRRTAFRVLLGAFLFSILQVLWVRFLPPPPTLTMMSRKWEAWRAGKPAALDRRWIGRDEVSDDMVRALLAGEDARFYQHHGFDWIAIRKAWAHNRKGGRLQGASTLTQQTARNLFLWQGRSWLRKGLEAYYTVLLELMVPKERILVLYLNVAEWGDRVFGVEAAAQRDFHVPARRLGRGEAASLAACLPNPRRYPPTAGSRFIARRKAVILRRMDSIHPDEDARVEVDDDEPLR
jgi:monofunctional biosynthetic peptidoglycan transglycosylase